MWILRGDRNGIAAFRLKDLVATRFQPRFSASNMLLPGEMAPPLGVASLISGRNDG